MTCSHTALQARWPCSRGTRGWLAARSNTSGTAATCNATSWRCQRAFRSTSRPARPLATASAAWQRSQTVPSCTMRCALVVHASHLHGLEHTSQTPAHIVGTADTLETAHDEMQHSRNVSATVIVSAEAEDCLSCCCTSQVKGEAGEAGERHSGRFPQRLRALRRFVSGAGSFLVCCAALQCGCKWCGICWSWRRHQADDPEFARAFAIRRVRDDTCIGMPGVRARRERNAFQAQVWMSEQ